MLLQEIIERLGLPPVVAEIGQREIHGAASLREAGPEEISFFADPRYGQTLRRSRAGAVLVPTDFAGEIRGVALPCPDPAAAFAKVLEWFQPPPISWPPGIHPQATVSPEATVHPTCSVQPGVVIEAGARVGARTVLGAGVYIGHRAVIGEDCFFYPGVYIGERCLVGHRVILHAGVVIGADGFGYELSEGRQKKIPQTGIVQIDDDVEIGANSCVDRARFGRTHLCEGVKVDNLVQIGHNVVIGPHSVLCAQVGISGSTRLGRYVVLAGKVGVAGHVEIADQVTAAAMAGIPGNIAKPGIYCGIPAVPMDKFKRNLPRVLNLHKLYDRVAALEKKLGLLAESDDAADEE